MELTEKQSYARRFYQSRVEAGLCKSCSRPSLPTAKAVCEHHFVANIAIKRMGSARFIPELLAKLKEQNYRCPYTGELLVLGVNASLDHIKPVSKYPNLSSDITNVEWICLDVNIAKRDLEKDAFVALCKRVIDHRN